jgi:hypothetical protein
VFHFRHHILRDALKDENMAILKPVETGAWGCRGVSFAYKTKLASGLNENP